MGTQAAIMREGVHRVGQVDTLADHWQVCYNIIRADKWQAWLDSEDFTEYYGFETERQAKLTDIQAAQDLYNGLAVMVGYEHNNEIIVSVTLWRYERGGVFYKEAKARYNKWSWYPDKVIVSMYHDDNGVERTFETGLY